MSDNADTGIKVETYKGMITISVEVFKTLILINGGAAVGVLTYAGNLKRCGTSIGLSLTQSLTQYSWGIGLTIFATMLAYITQFAQHNEEHGRWRSGVHMVPLLMAAAMVIASGVFFMKGCFSAAEAIGSLSAT